VTALQQIFSEVVANLATTPDNDIHKTRS